MRLPVIDKKLIANGDPARGDVVVFRYPPDPRIDYIKRVVGLPGDEVAWLNKKLTINGKPVDDATLPDYFDEDSGAYTPAVAARTWPASTTASCCDPTVRPSCRVPSSFRIATPAATAPRA